MGEPFNKRKAMNVVLLTGDRFEERGFARRGSEKLIGPYRCVSDA
jgi:hypothetical protein